eukprot:scaffold227397_cov27-Tisochrysis_lutea.AAC.1
MAGLVAYLEGLRSRNSIGKQHQRPTLWVGVGGTFPRMGHSEHCHRKTCIPRTAWKRLDLFSSVEGVGLKLFQFLAPRKHKLMPAF